MSSENADRPSVSLTDESEHFCDVDVNLAAQLLEQRGKAFIWCRNLIIFFVIVFVIMLVLMFAIEDVRQAALTHYHLMLLPMALIVLPSALMWGAMRGIYKMNRDELADVIKEIVRFHPLG